MKTFILSIMLLFAVDIFAQPKNDGPCSTDREKFCKDVEPRAGKLLKCFRENKDKLSSECKAHIENMKEKAKETQEACHEDMQKFCKDEKPGGGRILKCMKQHADELSEKCKSEFASRRGMRSK